MRILNVLTTQSELGNTSENTGFWLEEFTTFYFLLNDAGAIIFIAYLVGGQPCIFFGGAQLLLKQGIRRIKSRYFLF